MSARWSLSFLDHFLPPRKGERCMKTKCIYKQAKIMVLSISYNKILVSLAKFFFQFSWEILFILTNSLWLENYITILRFRSYGEIVDHPASLNIREPTLLVPIRQQY